MVADHLEPGQLLLGEFRMRTGVARHDPALEIFPHGVVERREAGVEPARAADDVIQKFDIDGFRSFAELSSDVQVRCAWSMRTRFP